VPIYEYRCEGCRGVNSVYLRSFTAADPTECKLCGADSLYRIISRVAYIRSEMDKLEQLDPKYHKMVDEAIGRAPANSDPDYHMDRMVPFSQAREKGEPYFKE